MKRKEFKQTTNRRVHNILYKEHNASCTYSSWHPRYWGNYMNDNDRWEVYGYQTEEVTYGHVTRKKGEGKYPNWKKVSKNPKQWMKKPILIVKEHSYYLGRIDPWVYIQWKIRKRQKPR